MRELGVEVVEGAVGSILEGALKRKQEAGSSELHT
jgi:hypothetical protein